MTHSQIAPFTLPDLPYAENALAPHLSAETLKFHHGKHHKAYVDKLNELVQGNEFVDSSLDQIVVATTGKKAKDKRLIFNNAGQHWNHSFFWKCMAPSASRDSALPAPLEQRILKDFGSVDKFKKEFVAQGVGQFGSGWIWLIEDGDRLALMATHDADNPLAQGKKALLTFDVWEHAYYLDYQNRRPDFLTTFVEQLANWRFAAANLSASGDDSARRAAE